MCQSLTETRQQSMSLRLVSSTGPCSQLPPLSSSSPLLFHPFTHRSGIFPVVLLPIFLTLVPSCPIYVIPCISSAWCTLHPLPTYFPPSCDECLSPPLIPLLVISSVPSLVCCGRRRGPTSSHSSVPNMKSRQSRASVYDGACVVFACSCLCVGRISLSGHLCIFMVTTKSNPDQMWAHR